MDLGNFGINLFETVKQVDAVFFIIITGLFYNFIVIENDLKVCHNTR
jgi:hypothetical protein